MGCNLSTRYHPRRQQPEPNVPIITLPTPDVEAPEDSNSLRFDASVQGDRNEETINSVDQLAHGVPYPIGENEDVVITGNQAKDPVTTIYIPLLATVSKPHHGQLEGNSLSLRKIPDGKLIDFWGCDGQEAHQCGKMIVANAILPRCEVYKRDYASAAQWLTKYRSWWEIINMSSISTPLYARPGNCIKAGKELVDSTTTTEPYIAVSYVWDKNPSFVNWHGREVTTQALQIVEQLSNYTSHDLWIDAICIPQNDIPVKQVELKKMADIYRGALAVLCLVPEVDQTTCVIVGHAAVLMDMEGFHALEEGGDTHGMYMFASQGSNETLRELFGSTWWRRAWTFQEAVLNNSTFIVGKNMETIPISDVLRICGPVWRRAATQEKEVLGQSSSFWDSINSMKTAISGRMPLGVAMSNVWRRQCTIPHDMAYSLLGVCHLQEIVPNYSLSSEEVFMNLVEKASSEGDFSWLTWAHLIDRSGRVSMVPIPETIRAAPTSAITVWHSIKIHKLPSLVRGEFGVCIPHRSTGVVRWQSNPEGIQETIKTLRNLSYSPEQIWNLLFGIHVGLASDIDQAAGGSGLAQPLLTLTSGYVDGTLSPSTVTDDMVGEMPYTKGYGLTSYALMATKVWKDARLSIMQSQGGITVVPVGQDLGQARIHRLPLENHSARDTHLCIVVHDITRFKVSAVGIMIEREHTGSGAWQLTRFS